MRWGVAALGHGHTTTSPPMAGRQPPYTGYLEKYAGDELKRSSDTLAKRFGPGEHERRSGGVADAGVLAGMARADDDRGACEGHGGLAIGVVICLCRIGR